MHLQLPNNNGISLIDAKGNNSYIAIYQNNKLIMKPQMIEKSKISSIRQKYQQLKIYTDYQSVDIFRNIIVHEDEFKLVKNICKLVPLYVKKAL
ncbi:hypothetical protein FACS1894166_07870 [Bacilli bacterium]|nr:hypothetical protein FACS1894166_07870 [Bacilli bacterium]